MMSDEITLTPEQRAKADAYLDAIQDDRETSPEEVEQTVTKPPATPPQERETPHEPADPDVPEESDEFESYSLPNAPPQEEPEAASPSEEPAPKEPPEQPSAPTLSPERLAELEAAERNLRDTQSEIQRERENAARIRAEAEGILQGARNLPPDQFQQFVRSYTGSDNGNGTPDGVDPDDPLSSEISSLRRELQSVRQAQQARDLREAQQSVLSAFEREVRDDDPFSRMGMTEDVRQRVLTRAFDPERPVYAHNVQEKIREMVAEERQRFADLEKRVLKDYADRHREKSNNTPAPTKGPSAPALSAPVRRKKIRPRYPEDSAYWNETRRRAAEYLDAYENR